jgi:hypothetical protein
MTGRIDVHCHIIPPKLTGMAGLKPPDWSEELALTALDRAGVVTAVVSIWGPGVHFGDDPSAWALARKDERVRNRPSRAPRRAVRPVRLGAAARRA